MSLLSRLFRRIGIDENDQVLLEEEERITDLSDLLFCGRTAGSAVTNLKLNAAMDYMEENIICSSDELEKVVEGLFDLEEWTNNSWELFLFRRFDLVGDKGAFQMLLEVESSSLTKSVFEQKEQDSSSSAASSNFKLSESDLRELQMKVQNVRNWSCNPKTLEVDLYIPIVDFLAGGDGAIVSSDSETENSDRSMSNPTMSVPFKACFPLFHHQLNGIARIVSNFERGLGGLLLGDEMGLGKTRQVLVSLLALMQNGRVKRAIIVSPPGIIRSWVKELQIVHRGFPKLRKKLEVVGYSSDKSKEKRDLELRLARNKARDNGTPLLVIASSSLVGVPIRDRYDNPLFPTGNAKGNDWDWVIVDEAHKGAKNPKRNLSDALRSKTSKFAVGSFMLLLTATPIENNMQEFCHLLSLVTKDSKEYDFIQFFKQNRTTIGRGQQMNASQYDRERTSHLINELQVEAGPYMLQRSMEETLKGVLPSKNEYVAFVRSSKAQWDATERLLKSDMTEKAKGSNNKLHVFAVIQRLRMICAHPFFADHVSDTDMLKFLSNQSTETLDNLFESDDGNVDDVVDNESMKTYLSRNRISDILKDAPMMRVCKDILVQRSQTGHKILVFCEFRKALDILAHVLDDANLEYCRIDGSVKQSLRDKYIDDINCRKSSTKIALITTRAGGLGLTLTGADTVINLGPSWNPMADAQAIGRSYRIGQKRPVTVFRLCMADLIDALIFGKQIQKEALIKDVQTETGGCLPRYLNDKDLSKLLTLGKRGSCEILKSLPAKTKVSTELHIVGGHSMVHCILRHEAIYRKFNNRYTDKNQSGQKRTLDSILPGSDDTTQQQKSQKVIVRPSS